MFTKVAPFAMVGAMLTNSNDTVSKPTCCLKKAYCCSIKRDSCPKSAAAETTVAMSDVAVSDEVARPTCCAKRAYCCAVKRSCCPRGSSAHVLA